MGYASDVKMECKWKFACIFGVFCEWGMGYVKMDENSVLDLDL